MGSPGNIDPITLYYDYYHYQVYWWLGNSRSQGISKPDIAPECFNIVMCYMKVKCCNAIQRPNSLIVCYFHIRNSIDNYDITFRGKFTYHLRFLIFYAFFAYMLAMELVQVSLTCQKPFQKIKLVLSFFIFHIIRCRLLVMNKKIHLQQYLIKISHVFNGLNMYHLNMWHGNWDSICLL